YCQRSVAEDVHVRAAGPPQRGQRRDTHHCQDRAEDQGEQAAEECQLDIDPVRRGNVVLGENVEELTHSRNRLRVHHTSAGEGRWCGRADRPHHRQATHSLERGVGGFWSGLGVYSTPSRFLSRNSCQLPSSIILLMASVIAWHLSEPGGIPTP